jgi:predicted DNA-binding ArsR family transcriptional regulator
MAGTDMKSTITLVKAIVAIPKSIARQRTPSEEVALTVQMVQACVEAGATSAQDVIDTLSNLQPLIKAVADPAGS